jgi:hypothetical protein
MGAIRTADIRNISRRVAKELSLAINDVLASATSEKEILKSLRSVIMHQPKLRKLNYSMAMVKLLCREDNDSVRLAAAGGKKRKGRKAARRATGSRL